MSIAYGMKGDIGIFISFASPNWAVCSRNGPKYESLLPADYPIRIEKKVMASLCDEQREPRAACVPRKTVSEEDFMSLGGHTIRWSFTFRHNAEHLVAKRFRDWTDSTAWSIKPQNRRR